METSQTKKSSFSIDSLLEYTEQGKESGHEARVGALIVERMRANYGRLYALYQQLLCATEEGIYEVTLRSATQTVTLLTEPRGAIANAAQDLTEELCEELSQHNKNILHQLKDQELELARRGTYEGSPESRAIHALCLPQPESAALLPAA